jgi:hypothetical protein
LERGIEEYTEKLLSVPTYAVSEAKRLIERSWVLDLKSSFREVKEGQLRCIRKVAEKFR